MIPTASDIPNLLEGLRNAGCRGVSGFSLLIKIKRSVPERSDSNAGTAVVEAAPLGRRLAPIPVIPGHVAVREKVWQ